MANNGHEHSGSASPGATPPPVGATSPSSARDSARYGRHTHTDPAIDPMKPFISTRLIAIIALLCGLTWSAHALTPPVVRSTEYNGTYSNIVFFPVQPWMNTNTTLMTVEAWVSCRDLIGNQAFIARHFTTNFYFGVSGNKLRFYRSGGTSADSDGTLVPNRWTHVAVTYDGTTARFYINGILAGTKGLANAGNNCTNSLSLGGEHDIVGLGDAFAGGYAFNGYLDEVRLWTVVRSQSAIAANMNAELRSGTGLLATFGSGGNVNELRAGSGSTDGILVSLRRSGFGILPSALCIPFTTAGLRVDGDIDLLNEYRGAETIVLRSSLNGTTPDHAAYLMVSTNSTNFHLYVGIPELQSSGLLPVPVVQIAANVNLNDGTNVALGDWECRLTQDSFQGGTIFGVNPPFFPTPQWLSWGQSALNWQAATVIPFEFDQSYEFRIHGRNLNYFTNAAALLVRYYDFNSTEQLIAPRTGVTNLPATYATANWCGAADRDLVNITISGVVSNITSHANESGWTVTLRSGLSALDVIRTIPVSASGTFSISGEVPQELPFYLILESRDGYTKLPPEFYGSGRTPTVDGFNSTLTYSPCGPACALQSVRFRVQSPPGPVSLTSVTPPAVPAMVVVRTDPLKTTPAGTITIHGANLHNTVRVYFKSSGCIVDPPTFCDSSTFVQGNVISTTLDRTSIEVELPALQNTGIVTRDFQIVVEDTRYLSSGGSRWNYGPSVSVTPPLWPQLHSFEFANQDDHPSVEEFEACYDNSIFIYTPIPIRDPFYGLWAAVYFGWMEGCQGSCYGMAGTSRLIQEGTLPVSLFDTPASDGVHGVRFGNGLVGPPCAPGGELCPPRPAHWTGFDLFQPYRTQNLWGRITSMAGAQTSAEAITSWLEQLGVPVRFGPRRGFASGSPVNVLNRVRTAPGQYTLCVNLRDFGGGHCVTPYAVTDGMGLAADAMTPISAPNFSLIKVYDNNWPAQERFIEVDRVNNSYRYQSGALAGGAVHEGPGLFSTPMSIYRSARHAPDPFFMARYGIDFLRLLTTGASTMTATNAAGGRAGWTATGLTNTYEGALPFLPPGLVPGVADRFDTTMFFLPASNAPTGVTFKSGGSNITAYAGLGFGDMAIGYNESEAAAISNWIYGIMAKEVVEMPGYSLDGLGFRTDAPVRGFSAMVSHRDSNRQSRVWLIDAGAGATTPDVHFEKDGFNSLKIRNHSAQPMSYRVNLAGYDLNLGVFEFASEPLQQPGNSTVILKPVLGAGRGFTRELDTNNDGTPEATDTLPARGALRASKESGLLALRWRPVTENDTLLCASNFTGSVWSPVGASVTTEGADRVTRLPLTGPHQFYRVTPSASNCFSLAAQPLGAKPNPWENGGFKFEALNAAGAMLPQNTILSRSGATGLDVIHTMRVQPLDDCHVIHLDVRQTSGLVIFEAVGPLGTVMSRQELVGAGAGVQRVTLRGFPNRIQFVRVISPNALCLIANICCERTQQPSVPPPYSNCQSVSNSTAGQFASPYGIGDTIITVTPGPVAIGPVSGLGGNWLKLTGTVELMFIPPSSPCDRVRLRVRDFEGGVTAKAFNAANVQVSEAGPLPGSASPQELVLNGPGITRVVLFSNSDKAFLQSLCCERNVTP